MPCRSDYMEPTQLESEIDRVSGFLTEITGTKYSSVYATSKANQHVLDERTAVLCTFTKSYVADGGKVTDFSLEYQIWWRDHQAFDRKREREEQEQKEKESLKKSALNKLSLAEQKALGLI